jgi:hypothetical protein
MTLMSPQCDCGLIEWRPCSVHGIHRPWHECADGEWRVGLEDRCLRCLDAVIAKGKPEKDAGA